MAMAEISYGSRSLKKGDQGTDVRDLQIKIVIFGSKSHPVGCDGDFGPATELALKKFQKYFSLQETGVADHATFQAIETWAESQRAVMSAFLESFKCDCFSADASTLKKTQDFWDKNIRGKIKLTDGSMAGDRACKGYGNGLTQVVKTHDATWTPKGTQDLTESPGIHKVLFWVVMGLFKIFPEDATGKGSRLKISCGYRCNCRYLRINANPNYAPAAMSNHTGNAIDCWFEGGKRLRPNGKALSVSDIHTQCIELRSDLEEFGVAVFSKAGGETIRYEAGSYESKGKTKYRNWLHLDTTGYGYKEYVQTVNDALAPRYTAGSATSPVVPPQGASQAPSGSGGEKGGGASSLDALLGYAENSKEWLQNSFSTFFDAYREGQLADAHDAIQADDGFFPIGKNLTWHGGIHAVGQPDGSVHAITDGVVVAARIPEKDPAKLSFGSRNFVLVKHQTPAGKPFWALYMHLRPIPLKNDDPKVAMLFPWLVRQKLKQTGGGGSNFRVSPDGEAGVLRTIGQGETLVSIEAKVVGAQKWIKAKADKDGLVGWLALTSRFEVKSEIDQLAAIQAGKVVNLNLPVKRGDCLGYMSPPKPGKKSFLHWEIFSDQVVSNQWLQVKDEDNDIVCDAVKFKELLNKSKAVTFFDSLTDSDIVAAYRDPKISAEIRKRAYFFKSEWAVEWTSALEKLKDDFEVDDLAPRLEPYNFWKEAEAAKCDIPKGGKVWHYRPPEFIAREFPAPKAAPVKAESTSAGANEEFDIDWDFIAQMEGTINKVYVPVDNGVVIGKSGPTVASGFDIGQRDAAGLKKFGFSPSLESKLIKYVSLSGSAALDFVNDNPCALSDDEVREVNHKVKPVYAKSAESFFNSQVPEGGKKFKSYPRGIQTAFVSVYFQYNTAKSLRASIIAGDYAEAANSLLTFTSKTQSVTHKTTKKKSQVMQYLPRRIKEARRLITAITDQDQLAKAKAYIKEKEEQWFDARGENV